MLRLSTTPSAPISTAQSSNSACTRLPNRRFLDQRLGDWIAEVAEGVETIQHAHIPRNLGCDTLHAFVKPMTKADLEAFLPAGNWRPRAITVKTPRNRIPCDFQA